MFSLNVYRYIVYSNQICQCEENAAGRLVERFPIKRGHVRNLYFYLLCFVKDAWDYHCGVRVRCDENNWFSILSRFHHMRYVCTQKNTIRFNCIAGLRWNRKSF